MPRRRTVLSALLVALLVSAGARPGVAEVFMPGTQPNEHGIEFAKVSQCRMCHAGTRNGAADPVFSWQGGMMAQAARDPVFRAALAIANQDVAGVGEFCIRCHSPRGWLEGRSKSADAGALTPEDLHGVSCDVCHHLVDPLGDEAKTLVEHVPPGYGSGMMVVDPANVVRGPYGEGRGAMPHGVLKSEHHASSALCAVCHNVSNPLQAGDVARQPPHAYGHVERTYSEWALSAFGEENRTCQSCHYPPVDGGGQASRFGSPQRDHFVMHGPVGGSTWVQSAVALLWPGRDVDAAALEAGRRRAEALLRTAAVLDLSFEGPRRALLRITNQAGHKLPSGYPEGRRMWVNARFLDADGRALGAVGRYGETQDTLAGEPVTVPTLLDPENTRVYECLPGLSDEQAARFGKVAGKSFHFVLNDVILKDNRIPPRGFDNAAFAAHLAQPVGATYADGQHWDLVALELPAGTARVVVRLMYQSVSWEYLRFLVEANHSDDWGRRLYDAWTKTGRCPPTSIAEIGADVTGGQR